MDDLIEKLVTYTRLLKNVDADDQSARSFLGRSIMTISGEMTDNVATLNRIEIMVGIVETYHAASLNRWFRNRNLGDDDFRLTRDSDTITREIRTMDGRGRIKLVDFHNVRKRDVSPIGLTPDLTPDPIKEQRYRDRIDAEYKRWADAGWHYPRIPMWFFLHRDDE